MQARGLQALKLSCTRRGWAPKQAACPESRRVCSAYDYVIPARGKAMCKTDICMAIPGGHYGRVAPRSGLTWKHSLDTGAGVIDEDYRGELCVILFNHSDTDFQVRPPAFLQPVRRSRGAPSARPVLDAGFLQACISGWDVRQRPP